MARPAMKVGFYVQTFECLGVEYLSAALKRAGHDACIFFDPVLGDDVITQNALVSRLLSFEDLLVERMAQANLDLVAFSVSADIFPRALRVAEKLKRRAGLPTVFGGIHVTSSPERVIEKSAVDYAIAGEGEEALVDLLDALGRGEGVADIANVCYQQDGETVINPPRPLVEDLDTLPFPDKSLFWEEAEGFHTSRYTIIASRGCLFSCTYCVSSAMRRFYKGKGHWLRRRSVDNVLAELRFAVDRYHPKEIRFWDDNFVDDARWVEEFSERYAAEIGLPFFVWANPRQTNRKVVGLLKKAGVHEISVGVQTAYESTRRTYLDRYDTNEQIVEALDAVRDAGLFLSTSNIVQLPGQTLDEARDLARFYIDNPVDLPYVFILRYYAQTAIVRHACEQGILTEESAALLHDPSGSRPNSVAQPDDERAFLKIRDFIVLTSLLPRFVSRFLLHNQRYEYLPNSATAAYLTVLCGLTRRIFTKRRHMACGFRLRDYILWHLRFIWLKLKWTLGKNRGRTTPPPTRDVSVPRDG